MQRAMMLCMILITISISFIGCSGKQEICAPIPQKCITPYTPYADINNTLCPEKDYKCAHDKALSNYEAKKQEADLLRSNSQVCR